MLNSIVFALIVTQSAIATPINPVAAPIRMADPPAQKEKGLPPFEKVAEGYKAVVSSIDGQTGFYTLYRNDKDQLLIELPAGYDNQPILIAYTIASGIGEAGVQIGDMYAYWTRIHDQLVLVEPNLETRTTGDAQSKQGYERVFTDRVILDVRILTEGPHGGPVFDGTGLFLRGASNFFGGQVGGSRSDLGTLVKAKSFPNNIELGFKLPLREGKFGTLSYSIRSIPQNTGYQPRIADHRIGYFTTTYMDIGDPSKEDPWVRYVNRWQLEKADPKLKMSPPKQPIVFYLEHTIPVRYRRWVRDGILEWNKAYEQVGIVNAIEVYQQDASTGAHMEKDPEDARYNFILWTNANMGFAIGPSRVDPTTGRILDADIVMDEGFVRGWTRAWHLMLPEVAMESFDPAAREWLKSHPNWDPRVRLASPLDRPAVLERIARESSHPARAASTEMIGDDEYDGLGDRMSQVNGACMYPAFQAAELSMARMHPDILMMLAEDGDGSDDDEGDMLDGVPDWFIGPMLRDVIMHETGHTLGLRHNFKASTVYDIAEMNDKSFDHEAISGSVMDYNPININVEDGPDQGDFTMMTIGPYDYWAIEYGYTSDDGSLPTILARVNEPQLAYATDEETFDTDPSTKRFDWSKNPLDYAESQLRLVEQLRSTILERMVEDGDSWAKARRGYEMLLNRQFSAVGIAASWIGGTLNNRARKGDPGDRDPIEEISPEIQRRALAIVLDNTMRDEAWGLTPALLRKMTVEKWWDAGGRSSVFTNPSWPIHDRIGGMQASAISMLLNPSRLGGLYDGEFRNEPSVDVLTMAEVVQSVTDEIWSELENLPSKSTNRRPAISNLRRNLQNEHIARLIELSLEEDAETPSRRAMQSLVRKQLQEILGAIEEAASTKADAYTSAHLADASRRIEKALDAQFTIGGNDSGGQVDLSRFFGEER